MLSRASITCRMLSSSVVSPRQTLRKDQTTLKLNPAHRLVTQRMRLLTRCAAGLHFSAFHCISG